MQLGCGASPSTNSAGLVGVAREKPGTGVILQKSVSETSSFFFALGCHALRQRLLILLVPDAASPQKTASYHGGGKG